MKKTVGIAANRRNWLLLGVSCVPLLMAAPAQAEENVVLEDVVISANRTATPMKQTGSSVSVITADEIEKSQAVSVKELIGRVPGVTVSDNGGPGKASYVFVRGSGYKHLKILVDGMQVSDLTHLSASDVERIEVLKGNQSTLYGADAIGGVISITTKSGEDSSKLIEGSAFAEFGSQHTLKEGLSLRGRYDRVYYSASVTQYDTDGINISGHTDTQSENDGYENLSTNLRLGADVVKDAGALDLLNVEFISRFEDSEVEYDTSGTQDGFQVAKNERHNNKLTVRADLFDGMLSNEISGMYSTSNAANFNSGVNQNYPSDLKNRETKFEYKGVLKPVENHTFVFGADYDRDTIQGGSFQQKAHGVYGNYQLELLDKSLTITAGMRHDMVDSSLDDPINETTYRGTIGYYIESTGTRLHTSYGTGFRMPNADELQGGFNSLKPEKSRGYDFGVEQSLFDDRLVVDVTAFNTRITDEIVWGGNWSPPYVYENIASTRAFGLETSVEAEITPELQLVAAYTYQEAKNLSEDGPLSLRPKHSGNARIEYTPEAVEGLNTWLLATYQGRNRDYGAWSNDYMGGFVKYDVGMNYDWDYGITFYGRVENLLDKRYEVKSGYATAGISGFLGARVKF